jgi:hypothetical protein
MLQHVRTTAPVLGRQGIQDHAAGDRLDRRIAAQHVAVLRRSYRRLFQVQLGKNFLAWLHFITVEQDHTPHDLARANVKTHAVTMLQ